MAELLLDPAIRLWVILPIVMITFLVGIIRHYLSMLLQSKKELDLLQVSDSQALMRSRNLRENAKYIPNESFEMRRHFFNDEQEGYFKTQDRKGPVKNPISDPTMMVDMAKGNITNVLPMILIGGWINWHYSGFITTKVPFPLTLRFKAMLQRGIDLTTLDASWVSSVSWYFINVFGLRSMYSLVLGQDNGLCSAYLTFNSFNNNHRDLYLSVKSSCAGALIGDTVRGKQSIQLKSTEIRYWFLRSRGKPDYPEKNLSELIRKPTNSTHISRQVCESNPGHIHEGEGSHHSALSALGVPH